MAKSDVKPYIRSIAAQVQEDGMSDVTTAAAERYLMYGILLQNYALHFQE